MIYVDDQQWPAVVNGIRAKWSHLFCVPDTEFERARMTLLAKRIGLKSAWEQSTSSTHYDVTQSKRRAAIRAGAKSVTVREGALLRMKSKRKLK